MIIYITFEFYPFPAIRVLKKSMPSYLASHVVNFVRYKERERDRDRERDFLLDILKLHRSIYRTTQNK